MSPIINRHEQNLTTSQTGWMSQSDPPGTAALCFNSISPEQGAIEAAKFGKHSSASFGEPLTHAGYADVPASWFFCENDLCVVPAIQQAGIEAIEESWKGTEREGKKVDVTKYWCDHVPVIEGGARNAVQGWFESVLVKGGKE